MCNLLNRVVFETGKKQFVKYTSPMHFDGLFNILSLSIILTGFHTQIHIIGLTTSFCMRVQLFILLHNPIQGIHWMCWLTSTPSPGQNRSRIWLWVQFRVSYFLFAKNWWLRFWLVAFNPKRYTFLLFFLVVKS